MTMLQYRLTVMPTPLKRALKKLPIEIAKESFKRKKSWLLYSHKDISPILKEHNVEFKKENIADTGWEIRWRDYIQDGWLTDNAYYCFEPKSVGAGKIAIQINPALAFGTGSHATTQIAARLMENHVKGQTVLDIGTGSGILAILASMSGAHTVFACDIDPIAIKNATENITLNKCKNIHLWAGGIESINPKFKPNVVVANIISSVLQTIHPQIVTLHPKYIIYAGILKKDGGNFFSSIKTHKYEPESILHIKEWSGILLKKVI
jgi:ribosomal protein L11 methyltransferase